MGLHGSPETVKTTLLMPRDLWQRAKVRAVEERRDLKDLLLEGLELVLRSKRDK
jgi:hypothetical protein